MPDFKLIDVSETPYLFVAATSSTAPGEIASAMGKALQQVWDFMQAEGIAPAGGALSVYDTYDPAQITFRAGFTVSREDMAKARAGVEADVTPAGEVLHFVHKGPYSTLRDDYGLMMAHIVEIGREISAPTWEVYLNDPTRVPEEELLTEVYSVLK
ncbi:GyrI-like domain-containing protein [Roseibium aggregatum]|uniref:GyrI-like domain-containing protein n=1 Tax=Roseibium aggregatum TaxID=187304 RepID=A0A939J0S0_9HYPH|nr:GyrI-like domain-containing protein [Roseibium aggregatum]MBN9669583.1 GyrI-like domain-containing protein [Roseibium aggregatum]